jgi:hypothetical protein
MKNLNTLHAQTPKTESWKHAASIFATAAFSLSLIGCVTDPAESLASLDEDGQAAYLKQEVESLGEAYEGSAAGKSAAFNLTIEGELVIHPLGFREECECLVREAEFTGSRGYERTRLDSIYFVDSDGNFLTAFDRDAVVRVIHKRHVIHTKNGKQADLYLNTEMEWKNDGGDRYGVWNGTMTGEFNGQTFKSGTITDVRRPFADGRFGFAEAGMISVERPLRLYDLEFLGEGKAKVTITQKVTGVVRVFFLSRNNEITEAE